MQLKQLASGNCKHATDLVQLPARLAQRTQALDQQGKAEP